MPLLRSLQYTQERRGKISGFFVEFGLKEQALAVFIRLTRFYRN